MYMYVCMYIYIHIYIYIRVVHVVALRDDRVTVARQPTVTHLRTQQNGEYMCVCVCIYI